MTETLAWTLELAFPNAWSYPPEPQNPKERKQAVQAVVEGKHNREKTIAGPLFGETPEDQEKRLASGNLLGPEEQERLALAISKSDRIEELLKRVDGLSPAEELELNELLEQQKPAKKGTTSAQEEQMLEDERMARQVEKEEARIAEEEARVAKEEARLARKKIKAGRRSWEESDEDNDL
jgi:hypothetical protein